MGRPRIPEDQLRHRTREVLLTDGEEEILQYLSKKHNKPKSFFLRDIAFRAIESEYGLRVNDSKAS